MKMYWSLMFWMFVIIKVWGTAFAAWSWWWILLAAIPDMWLILSKAGLLS